jgi:branched-chain amino acid transport system ATP-binding protein
MALLEVRGLGMSFGGVRALHNVNVRILEGELLGLIGPNGAGKTTMFNLVCGFYQPSRGEILLRGKNILGLPAHVVTSLGIARTFQSVRLWNNLTVFENLCVAQHHLLGYGLLDSLFRTKTYWKNEQSVVKTVHELLDMLDILHLAKERPGTLPYGLQRRVEIARALAARPRLLLLDEPAAGMNPGEVVKLMELIRWVREKFSLTIWLIEHQMRMVMDLCDRVTVLDFGETIAEGTPLEIKQNPRVIQAYLGNEELYHA